MDFVGGGNDELNEWDEEEEEEEGMEDGGDTNLCFVGKCPQ